MYRKKLALAESIEEGHTLKFDFDKEGISREGFITKFQGKILAYENCCKHLPLTLDLDDNSFFDPSGQRFVCQAHGAEYEPLSGLCVAGPCQGAQLEALPLLIENDTVYLDLAHSDET